MQIFTEKELAESDTERYYIPCAWGYSSVGERSVRIREAVGSNPIISRNKARNIVKFGIRAFLIHENSTFLYNIYTINHYCIEKNSII